MQASDFMGIINRHILAPRARTQEDMNFYMRGSEIEIAERYTRMTILYVWLAIANKKVLALIFRLFFTSYQCIPGTLGFFNLPCGVLHVLGCDGFQVLA